MTAVADRARPVRESRRLSLRDATQTIHDRLEALLDATGAFAHAEGYRAYLDATGRARLAVEETLQRANADAIWSRFESRCISGLIAQDARDLARHAIDDNPLPEWAPAQLEPEEILGALYVLEGSALGARILVNRAAALGYTRDFGARHLHAQADDRTAWPDYLRVLEAADLDDEAERRAADMAEAVFAVFEAAYRSRAGQMAS